jgi:hypothetical protein
MKKALTVAEVMAQAVQVCTDAIGAVRFVFKSKDKYSASVVKDCLGTPGWIIRVDRERGSHYLVEVVGARFDVFAMVDEVALPDSPKSQPVKRKPKRKGK